MTVREDYEKLRGELGKIFLEGDKNELLLDLFSDSLDSKTILEPAREMKDEGNSLFKLGKFEEALEKYGEAEVILVGYKFEETADRTKFCELSLCVLLNSSACFSKLKEFDRVGQVCSIILDCQPNNIKAMYRRAMAAIELGKHEWAYWDLVLAAEISPNNQEVVKKLEEVKHFIHRKRSKDHNHDHPPKGVEQGNAIYHKESQESAPAMFDKEDAGNQFERRSKEETCRNFCNMEITDFDYCQKVNEKEMEKDEIKEGRMEEAGQCHSANDLSSTVTEDTERFSNECNDEVINPQHLEESMYRFHNQKKQGSQLSISKSNYLLMTQGKSLKFFNSKLGSFVNKLEKEAADVDKQSTLETMKQEHRDSEEMHSGVDSCVTSDNNLPEDCGEASSGTHSLSTFKFSSNSNSEARKKNHIFKSSRTSPRVPVKQTKRRKLQIVSNGSFLHPNFDCDCRFEIGMKRKCAHLLPLDFHHHSRKKKLPLFGR